MNRSAHLSLPLFFFANRLTTILTCIILDIIRFCSIFADLHKAPVVRYHTAIRYVTSWRGNSWISRDIDTRTIYVICYHLVYHLRYPIDVCLNRDRHSGKKIVRSIQRNRRVSCFTYMTLPRIETFQAGRDIDLVIDFGIWIQLWIVCRIRGWVRTISYPCAIPIYTIKAIYLSNV